VTGGAGFIGSHLIEILLAKRHDVVVVDSLITGTRSNVPRTIPFYTEDIRDPLAMRNIFSRVRPRTVWHLAGQPNVRRSIEDPVYDADVNVAGGANILDACRHAKVSRLVFASSGGAIYGPQSRYPCHESDTPKPPSPYGLHKLTFEMLCLAAAATGGPRFIGLRLANVYGARQDPAGEAGAISLFLTAMLNGTPPTIFGDGQQTRDYVYVKDVARAFLLANNAPAGIYNIGTGVETSVADLAWKLGSLLKFKKKPQRRPAVLGEVRQNCLNIHKARTELRWTAKTTLVEGLGRTIMSMR